ncbi:MAG: hypothetical protein K5644_10630 [Lachnospiraceae bacterium]|nr:hypothetical protein [Lachnospiraceae bacterium]
MNNLQRICEVCILNNIYTPEEIESLLKAGKEPEVHTKSYWRKKGKIPIDNDSGIKTKLWTKKSNTNEYFLVNTTLYSENMVKKI